MAQVFFIRGVEILGPGRAGVFVNLVPILASLAAVRLELPIMTVLVNNGVMGGYGAYMPDAVEKYQASSMGGDYTAMAQAMGGYAERIESASEVRDALSRGIQQTEAGRPVLLEFITKEEPVLAMANKWGM